MSVSRVNRAQGARDERNSKGGRETATPYRTTAYSGLPPSWRLDWGQLQRYIGVTHHHPPFFFPHLLFTLARKETPQGITTPDVNTVP